MSGRPVELLESWARANQADSLPIVTLPSGSVTITECAEALFGLIAPTHELFTRSGVPVRVIPQDDATLALEVLVPAAARSFFERFARLAVFRKGRQDELVLKPTQCPLDMADALLRTELARRLLPAIRGLVNCPILREVDGSLTVATAGYDPHSGIYVTGGGVQDNLALEEAVQGIRGLFVDFDFQSEGDYARAVAGLLSPALKLGGLLRGRVPADVAEADQSQSGKTYRQKVLTAVYNGRVSLVASRQGGVGSVDETFDHQLLQGNPFIQFDNFRGRFDSARLEAFLTAEGSFSCRVPHRGEVVITPENYFVFLTSNGVDTTRDLANRSNIIRIRKKPAGHVFTVYPEGHLLEHVRARQPYYLGCVFTVVREWHRRGKPRSAETRHDFREWVQVLDWIAQELLGTRPIMEGHKQAQERVSNPAAVWLRKVVLAVVETGGLGKAMIASEVFELCADHDIEIPGVRHGGDAQQGMRAVGRQMSKLFGTQDCLEVEGFAVTRLETYVERDNSDHGGNYKSKTYTVTQL